MKAIGKRVKAVLWDSYKEFAAAGFICAAALLVLNLVFIDWGAFVYHGITEAELTKTDFLYHLINVFMYIVYAIIGGSLVFSVVVIAAGINKNWSKILCYAVIGVNGFLFFYALYFATGLKESLGEILLANIYYILLGLVFVFLLMFFIKRCRFRNKLTAITACIVIIGLSVLPFVPKKAFAFGSDPVVYDGGDSYVIAWTTTTNALAWIDADIDGHKQTIYDQTNAMANVNSRFHKVSVPKKDANGEEIEGFSYKIYSKKLLWRSAAFYKYGKQIESRRYNFSVSPMDSQSVTAGVFSDVHGQYKLASKVIEYMGNCDFYILLGDMATAVFSEEKALKNVDFAGEVSRGEKLIYPVRGNHEDRGTHYQLWQQHIVTPTQKLYYTIEYNGLKAVVLDSGSDYADDTPINGGATFWTENTEEQLDWLTGVSYEGAKWRAAISHINFMYDDLGLFNGIDQFGPVFKEMGAEILIHGHDHRIGKNNFTMPGDYEGVLFPSYAVGGYKKTDKAYAATKLLFAQEYIEFKQFDHNGTIRVDRKLPIV